MGLLLINTGSGKGKTTAAIGTAVRALGYGQSVAFLQFIKSSPTGESLFLEELANQRPDLLFYAKLGLGFVKDKPTPEDVAGATEAMSLAERISGRYNLLILDEACVALDKKLVSLKDMICFLKNRPKELNVILTGRGCPVELYELADTVTEMTDIKHAYHSGIPALKGIDF